MKYTKEILKEAVSGSLSLADVVRYLHLPNGGDTYRYIRSRIKHFEIDTSHFKASPFLLTKKEKLHFKEVLVKNRLSQREDVKILRRALIESGVKHQCKECGLKDTWNNKPIRLQIDHLNGDSLDNTKCNLRFLCPNCHSQTDNYVGNKLKKVKVKKRRVNKNCKRPSKEILQDLLFKQPSTKIAAKYGVSGKAVEKWCKFYDLEKPGRGFWAKQKTLVV